MLYMFSGLRNMNTTINMAFDLEKDLKSAVEVGIRTAVYW